jgi:hypothetical protein
MNEYTNELNINLENFGQAFFYRIASKPKHVVVHSALQHGKIAGTHGMKGCNDCEANHGEGNKRRTNLWSSQIQL